MNLEEEQDQGDQADLLDFDLDFEEIFRFCDISVLVTYQFCGHSSFGDFSVLMIFQFL